MIGKRESRGAVDGGRAVDDAVDALFRESGLADQRAPVAESVVLEALRTHYGIEGRLARLETEKDSTFRVNGTCRGQDGEFLVKVSHPDEPDAAVRCQVDVVGWVERHDAEMPVQTVVPDDEGRLLRPLQDDAGRALGLLRVHEFIPGALLVDAERSSAQLREVGATLGRLDAVLRDFSHPGAERVLVWDLARFMQVRPLVALEADPRHRDLAQAVFENFGAHVAPALAGSRTQVIHGDFSPYNVVVDPAAERFVRGVIDFGDAIRTPVIFDPAVLLGNHLQEAPLHPWEQARELLAGYRREFPLSSDEVRMVVTASLARVTLRALVASWRIERGTERADYVRAHARHDWGRLENALAFGVDAAFDYLMHATTDKER